MSELVKYEKRGSVIRAINRDWIKKEKKGINPKYCHVCKETIRCAKQFIPNKYIFENAHNNIFLIVHPKCKKEVIKQIMNLKKLGIFEFIMNFKVTLAKKGLRIIILPNHWNNKRYRDFLENTPIVSEEILYLVGETKEDPHEIKVKEVSEDRLRELLELNKRE